VLYANLGTRFYWVFVLALSRSRQNSFTLRPWISRFCVRAFALLVYSRLYFRALYFLSCYWFPFALPVSIRPRVSLQVHMMHDAVVKFNLPLHDAAGSQISAAWCTGESNLAAAWCSGKSTLQRGVKSKNFGRLPRPKAPRGTISPDLICLKTLWSNRPRWGHKTPDL
jgi:hypothetical protein